MNEYSRKMLKVPSYTLLREQDMGKLPVLDVRNLGIAFGGHTAVAGITLSLGPPELSGLNGRAEVERAHTHDAVRTNPALSPQHLGDVEEVNRLLTLAYGYLDLGKYDEAIETFESIRKYDAYNTAAQRGIEQAQKRRAAYYRTAHDATRAKMLADVDATWDESPNEVGLPPEAVGTEEPGTVTGALDSEVESSFANALGKMVMPQIVFEEASIADVIETLQNQILRFESSGVNASRHINISTSFGKPDSAHYKELMGQKVNLELSEVSVRDVLDMLASQLDITYYYTPIGVELSYSGKDFGPLLERAYTVPPHFYDGAGENAGDAEDDEEDAFENHSSGVSVSRVNPVQALKGMGISFPEGATARYQPSTRTLHVRNTSHNLQEIQELLNVPMAEERQIILNVIVMEMQQRDLEELGFDWLMKVGLGGEAFGGGGATQAATIPAGLPAITGVSQTEGDYMTSGLRSGSQAIDASSMDKLIETGSAYNFNMAGQHRAPGIFSLRGVWSAADVAVIMRGLSQKKGTDIVQNPQMVFSPGADEQVVFANVREMYYPESYEQGDIYSTTINRGNGNTVQNLVNKATGNNTDNRMQIMVASGSHPTDFVRYGMNEDEVGGIGTILQVHSADITEDGRFVNLALTTTVTDFEGFMNWGSPIKSVQWQPSSSVVNALTSNEKKGIVEIVLSPNYILKPIFKRRLVNTSLTVAPGSVLVFAGLKDAKKVRYEDKVPVLGDLPLIGRFFRSEGEEDSRKVLLYFAKVDLVDPSGRDVRTGERPSRTLH